jgi:F-type H+-transporting ATPase subunit delta
LSDFFAQTEVGARYAKAAFDLSGEQNRLDAVMQDLSSLKAMLIDSADLKRLVTDINYSTEAKTKGLTAVAQAAGFDPLTQKSLGLLIKNGRLNAVGSFIAAFTKLYEAHKGTVTADVTSAVVLTDDQLSALKAALGRAIGSEAIIKTQVDPSLLGGLKIKLGSRLFDSSLKTKLDSLKFALKRA